MIEKTPLVCITYTQETEETNCSLVHTRIRLNILKFKSRFINYELYIGSSIAFEAFLRWLKKSVSGG